MGEILLPNASQIRVQTVENPWPGIKLTIPLADGRDVKVLMDLNQARGFFGVLNRAIAHKDRMLLRKGPIEVSRG